MSTATMHLVHPRESAMKLVLYAPDRDLVSRLTPLLPAAADVQWQDSGAPAAALEPLRDTGCVLLLDFRHEQAAFSAALVRQVQAQAPELPLVAVGSTASDQLAGVVAALRAGLRDLIDLDATPHEIEAVLRRASATDASVRAPAAVAHKARMVLLLGVRAGVGCSTLAAHLGVLAQQAHSPLLAQEEDPPPVANHLLLLDLAQPAGDLALYLNLDSSFHYDDALRHASRIDATLARTAMTRHPAGLALLGQAAGTDGTPMADPAVLMQRLRGIFDTLLCDLGGACVRQIPVSLLNSADDIWLVADQAIGTLVSLDQALTQLERVGARDKRLQLVINRFDDASGISPAQIATRFGLPLLATLPDRARLRSAASHGRLLLQEAPRDPYLRALAPLLSRLDPAAAPAARSWREHLALRLSGSQWKTK
ncbi:fimbrial protein [Stenotrophomonas sp.]|uniref:AAA family ATPase n=2 Tax=Stenotrophomonas sp. TaxID=69392 RepID=UPI0028AFB85E|nr:fimbrial protein [Stenotrophomonas sp.]